MKPILCFPQTQSSVQAPLPQQGPSPGSWSTQSLSRSRGGSLAAKLPLRAVNGRISELLQGSAGSRSRSHTQGGGTDTAEERGAALARSVITRWACSVVTFIGHSCKVYVCRISLKHHMLNSFVLFPVLSGGGAGPAGGGGGGSPGEEKPALVQTLPSPYSKITAPRKPHRCSSGHASDNRYSLWAFDWLLIL